MLRAEKTGRIVEAAESITLDLKTKQNNGKSEFGQYDWTKATFLDMAEPYAQMLNKRGYDIARVGLVDSEELEYIGIDNTNVEVRLTVLGRIDSGHIHDAYSCFRFMEPGRARVVHGAREFSTGDKGKIIKLDEKVFAAIRKMYE